ncbi:hypothetical protein RHMOL_Rhmol09G0091100 [Rhododendron molle]|uniref:Uncharacterized protein n=1 Tax=Rhododendron molle TaxID=49168 RepID=A0ACC0MB73_RHOML|nr:hypothetical protein RHMOL_Rhmol09G0091100 [Rhododendron molle]
MEPKSHIGGLWEVDMILEIAFKNETVGLVSTEECVEKGRGASSTKEVKAEDKGETTSIFLSPLILKMEARSNVMNTVPDSVPVFLLVRYVPVPVKYRVPFRIYRN